MPENQGTRIFISCSGTRSHDVAVALSGWLKTVLNNVDPFVYTEKIEKGSQWFNELQGALAKCAFGILCMTPENREAPWLLFEAGGLYKGLTQSRIAPLLVGPAAEDLKPPLSLFQVTLPTKEDMKRLVTDINNRISRKGRITGTELLRRFDQLWPLLEQKLNALSAAEGLFEFDVFLSAPMAAFDDDAAYQRARLEIKKVFDAFKQHCNYRVYWAAEKIESIRNFDLMSTSVLDDLQAIRKSRYFVMVYPQKMATSALFEAGYALAQEKFSLYFTPKREELPFLLRELPGTHSIVRIFEEPEWRTYDDIVSIIRKTGTRLFLQAGEQRQ